MADGLYELYLSDNLPSRKLELYIGEFDALFNIKDCKTREQRDDCRDDLTEYFEDDDLIWFDGREAEHPNYYPVAAYRGRAYIIPSPEAMEELVGCGSLGDV